MLDKLMAIARRYEEITQQLSMPDIASDQEQYRTLMKESAELQPIADIYDQIGKLESLMKEADALREDSDPETRELAESELAGCREGIRQLTEQARILLLPRDSRDSRNVIVEIRAGAGGEESALFASLLLRMYTMFAEKQGFTTEIVSKNRTELGGYKEVSFMVTGINAFATFKYESGVHRVQRVPETEAGGRIHTSTVTVAVLPEAEEVELNIDPADLQIDTYRSSGAGGQHINKTESAIRITHIPTGTVVECQDERSQYKNKDKAMRVLRSRLLDRKKQEQRSEIDADRRAQVGTGDRSERIRTYNFPQGRVTDHRIGLTLYKINAIMDGELSELIEALAASERADQLRRAEDE